MRSWSSDCLLSQNGHLTLIRAYSKGYFPHVVEMTIIGWHSCGDLPSDSDCVEIRYFASKGMSAGINRVSYKCVRGARGSCVVVNDNDYSAVFAVSLSVSTLTSLSVYGNAKTNIISILNACYQYGFLHNLTSLHLCRSVHLTLCENRLFHSRIGFLPVFLITQLPPDIIATWRYPLCRIEGEH